MSWFKVDDKFYSHPKVLQLSARAVSLWVRAGSWSSYYSTDGYIPQKMLAFFQVTKRTAEELVNSGLWETSEDHGYHFHDWERYQPTKDELKKIKQNKNKAHQLGAAKTNAKRWGTPIPKNLADSVSDDMSDSLSDNKDFVSDDMSDDSNIALSDKKRVAKGSLKGRPVPVPVIDNKLSIKEKYKKENFATDSGATAPASLLDEPYTTDFEQFWAVYPRKQGKREAFKAWKQAGANRPALPLVLAKATAYAASREVVEGYALNASRWIRERRWEDSPSPAPAAPQREAGVGMSRIETNLEHNRQLVAKYEAEEAEQQARQPQTGHADSVGVVPPLKLLNGRRVA